MTNKNEINQIEYEERDGLYYPLLTMAEMQNINSHEVGKYGRVWIAYMEECEPLRTKTLKRFGKLYETAIQINEESYELLEQITERYLEKHLKNPSSTMEQWKIRKQAKQLAEEHIFKELIYKFH